MRAERAICTDCKREIKKQTINKQNMFFIQSPNLKDYQNIGLDFLETDELARGFKILTMYNFS